MTYIRKTVDHPKETSEPLKNAAMFNPKTPLKDATITEFKQSQKHFQVYYEQRRMATGEVNLQRSFLDTCLYDDLIRIIGRETETTNPKMYAVGMEPSTMGILEKHFNNLHPIHIRLKRLASLYPSTNQTPVVFYVEFIRQINELDARLPHSRTTPHIHDDITLPRQEPQNGPSHNRTSLRQGPILSLIHI